MSAAPLIRATAPQGATPANVGTAPGSTPLMGNDLYTQYLELMERLFGAQNILKPDGQGSYEQSIRRNIAALLNGTSIRESDNSVYIDYETKNWLGTVVKKTIQHNNDSVVFLTNNRGAKGEVKGFDKNDAMTMALAASERFAGQPVKIENVTPHQRILISLAMDEINKTLPLEKRVRMENPQRVSAFIPVRGGRPNLEKYLAANTNLAVSAPIEAEIEAIATNVIDSIIPDAENKLGEEATLKVAMDKANTHLKSLSKDQLTNEGLIGAKYGDDYVYAIAESTPENHILYTLDENDNPVLKRVVSEGIVWEEEDFQPEELSGIMLAQELKAEIDSQGLEWARDEKSIVGETASGEKVYSTPIIFPEGPWKPEGDANAYYTISDDGVKIIQIDHSRYGMRDEAVTWKKIILAAPDAAEVFTAVADPISLELETLTSPLDAEVVDTGGVTDTSITVSKSDTVVVDPEVQRRRRIMERLKAAVAATVAERLPAAGVAIPDADDAPVKTPLVLGPETRADSSGLPFDQAAGGTPSVVDTNLGRERVMRIRRAPAPAPAQG